MGGILNELAGNTEVEPTRDAETGTVMREVNGDVLEVPVIDSKKLEIKISTKMRLIFLIASYIIAGCDMLGAFDMFIPTRYQSVVTTVCMIAAAAAAAAAYWFNNSWSNEATVVDKLLATIKHTAKYCPEIVQSIDASIAEFNKKTANAARSVTVPVPQKEKKE